MTKMEFFGLDFAQEAPKGSTFNVRTIDGREYLCVIGIVPVLRDTVSLKFSRNYSQDYEVLKVNDIKSIDVHWSSKTKSKAKRGIKNV